MGIPGHVDQTFRGQTNQEFAEASPEDLWTVRAPRLFGDEGDVKGDECLNLVMSEIQQEAVISKRVLERVPGDNYRGSPSQIDAARPTSPPHSDNSWDPLETSVGLANPLPWETGVRGLKGKKDSLFLASGRSERSCLSWYHHRDQPSIYLRLLETNPHSARITMVSRAIR